MPSWRQPPPGNCSDPGSPPAHGLGHLEGLVALHLNQPQTARWLPKLKQNNAASFPQQPSLPCFYSHSTGIFSLQAMFAMFCFAGNVTQSPGSSATWLYGEEIHLRICTLDILNESSWLVPEPKGIPCASSCLHLPKYTWLPLPDHPSFCTQVRKAIYWKHLKTCNCILLQTSHTVIQCGEVCSKFQVQVFRLQLLQLLQPTADLARLAHLCIQLLCRRDTRDTPHNLNLHPLTEPPPRVINLPASANFSHRLVTHGHPLPQLCQGFCPQMSALAPPWIFSSSPDSWP